MLIEPELVAAQDVVSYSLDMLKKKRIYISQTTQTAYLLSQGGLRRPKFTQHNMLRFYDRFLECHLTAT